MVWPQQGEEGIKPLVHILKWFAKSLEAIALMLF
jgi:hypothetical protein